MKLENLKHLWEKQVKIILIDKDIIIGRFVSFERAGDNDNGRDNITIETEENVLMNVYLDEIKQIDVYKNL